MRILFRNIVEFLPALLRDQTFLIFKYKVIASDHGLMVFDRSGNSMRYYIFNLGMHLLVCQMFLLGCTDNGFRHGMREMLFHTCGDTKHFIRIIVIKRNHVHNGRFRFCQSSGLVKYDGICLCHCLQIFTALNCNFVCTGLTDCGQYGDWHCKLQRTGEVYHQDRKSFGGISGKEICKCCSSKCIGNQLICQMLCLSLQRRFQLLRLLDHGDDLVITAGTSYGLYADGDLTFLHNSACIGNAALFLAYRYRLAGKRSLVDHSLSIRNTSVKRNYGTHTYNNLISRLDLSGLYQDLLIRSLQPYLANIQGHGSCKITYGFLMRPLFQDLSDPKQEHDGACSTEVLT